MSLHCFSIPALQPEPAQSELNAFLATERVVSVRRELVADGIGSFWAICVELAPGPGPLPPALKAGTSRGRDGATAVDYKLVLSPEDFALFAALRDWRKQRAVAEGVPVYAVFSNEQLAEIVQQRIRTADALAQVEGVGASRVDKYAAALSAWWAERELPAAAP